MVFGLPFYQIWFILNIFLAISVRQSKSEIFKTYPANENQDFRTSEKENKLIDGQRFGEYYPFYMHFIDSEVAKENDARKIPFVPLKSLRAHHHLPTCNCEMEYHHIDLGSDYVPRYLSTATCKSENCWSGVCRPRHYKIQVLRRKKNEEDITSASLPLELSDDFVREIKTVTVGCECKP